MDNTWPQTILRTFFAFFIASAMPLGHSASAGMISVNLSNPNDPGGGSQNDPFCKIQDWILAATNSDAMLVPPGTNCDLIVDQGASITVKSTDDSEVTTIDASADAGSEPAQVGNNYPEPDLPPGCEILEVPSGNRVSFHVYAKGVQIYKWDDTTKTWVFVAPSAALYATPGFQGLLGTHYAGPTWESNDGSTVVGHRLEGCSPDPTAIPWLLLEAVTSQGPGPFRDTTYIQRLFTTGGLAPDRQGTPGESVQVPYTAQYYFYRTHCSA